MTRWYIPKSWMPIAEKDEADLYSRYLINLPATPHVRALFDAAIASLRSPSDSADMFVSFSRKYRWSLGSLDAALAIVEPTTPLRQRLLIMFAILETQPQFADEFATFDHKKRDVARVVCGFLSTLSRIGIGLGLVGILRMRR